MCQFGFAGYDEAESRYTLNALVGAADHKVDTQFLYIQGYASETTHCIHNQLLAVHLYHVGNLLQRVQNAGRCFAMHHCHVCDFCVMCQVVVHIFHGYLFGFIKSKHVIVHAVVFGNVSHTVTVCAVAQNE